MDGERIQELFTAFITYMWEGARNGANWAKEHPVYAEYSNFASMDWERIKELFTAFIRYSWEAASNGAIWAEEHQEESKNPYLVWAAWVVLALMLYALVRGIEALLSVIFKLVIVVLKLPYWLVMLFIKLILRIVTTIILSILYCLGFTSSGVRSRSVASRGQSAFYGPKTRGVFSTMQSAGTRRR